MCFIIDSNVAGVPGPIEVFKANVAGAPGPTEVFKEPMDGSDGSWSPVEDVDRDVDDGAVPGNVHIGVFV